jgi:hypothetical protein
MTAAAEILAQMLQGLALESATNMSETLSAAFRETDAQMSEFEYEGCTATAALLWTSNGRRYLQVHCSQLVQNFFFSLSMYIFRYTPENRNNHLFVTASGSECG